MIQFYIIAEYRHSMMVEDDQVLVAAIRAKVNQLYNMNDGDFYMVANNRIIRDNETLKRCRIGPDSTITVNFRMRGSGGFSCPGCNNPAVRVYLVDSAGTERLTKLENNQALVSTLREKIAALLRESKDKFRIVSETGILQNDKTVASYGVDRIATVAIDSRMSAANGCATFVLTPHGPFDNLESMMQSLDHEIDHGMTLQAIPRIKYGKRKSNRSEKSSTHSKRRK